MWTTDRRLPLRAACVSATLAVALIFLSPAWGSLNRAGAAPADVLTTAPAPAPLAGETSVALTRAEWRGVAVGGLSTDVLGLALDAASCAVRAGDADPGTLTVIDYSRPSSEPRLWVLDLRSRRLLYEELVAHGQGSGANLATAFSNVAESHRSSLGLFVTDATYVGKNGYSLRLDGLDAGFNDNARARAIVMHGAPYVSAKFAKEQGRLGRSHGCPAVREAIARELIDRVKGGDLLFAYYPDQRWLSTSKYLGSCAAAAN
jgi:hypothetical protein